MLPANKIINQINLGNASQVNINIGDGNTQGINTPISNSILKLDKPIFAIPIQKNSYFTGRRQELKDIILFPQVLWKCLHLE